MAVVTVKSGAITNRDASVPSLSNDFLVKGDMFESSGIVSIGAADSVGSKYIFCSVPSGAKISQVLFWTDTATGANMACTLDLYDTPANGGLIVKAAFFQTALATNAIVIGKDVSINNLAANANQVLSGEQRIWESLGLTADPFKFYDVVMTSTVNNTTTGAGAKLLVRYVI